MIVSVFLTFKEILFALSQLEQFFKSMLKSLLSFLMELVRNKRLVSKQKGTKDRSLRNTVCNRRKGRVVTIYIGILFMVSEV